METWILDMHISFEKKYLQHGQWRLDQEPGLTTCHSFTESSQTVILGLHPCEMGIITYDIYSLTFVRL